MNAAIYIVIYLGLMFLALLIGRSRLLKKYKSYEKKQKFVTDYVERLNQYVKGHGQNMESYEWLIRHSTRMQIDSGHYGILTQYRPPFGNLVYRNHQIFLNLIQELRHYVRDRDSVVTTAQELYMIIYEALVRYSGYLDEQAEEINNKKNSPLEWLVEGISFLLSIPFALLQWIGILSTSTLETIINSKFLGILSKLTALLGFIAIIVGLVVDWSDFITKVENLFK